MSHSKTILIVDAVPQNALKLLEDMARLSGDLYTYSVASGFEDALGVCRSHMPSCIVTDYLLDERTGLDLLGALRGYGEYLPCPSIMITDQGNEMVAVEAMKLGAQDYLVRNRTTSESLLHAIDSAIRRFVAKQEREKHPEAKNISEERLQLAFRAAHMGTMEWNLNTRKMRWSAEMESLYGLRPGSFEGSYQDWIQWIHPDDQSLIERHLSELLWSGEASSEFRIIRPDGQIVWLQDHSRLIRNEAETPDRVIAVHVDITAQKKAEGIRRDNDERLRTVLENLHEGVIVADRQGNLLHCNRAALEMHDIATLEEAKYILPINLEGYTLDGRPLRGEDWPLARLVRGEKVERVDLCIRRRDRDWSRIIRCNGSVVEDVSGNPILFLSITDITEQFRTLAELENSRHLIQGIAEASPNVLYLFDLEKENNIYSNRRVSDILGYSDEELKAMGDNFLTTVTSFEDLTRMMKHFVDFQNAGDGEVRTCDYRMRHADGSYHWFQSRDVVFARDSTGRPTQVAGSATDITQLKQAEHALRDSQRRLERAQAVAHLGSVEHDFETNTSIWSEEFYLLLGLSLNEIEPTFENFLARLHPEDVELVVADMERLPEDNIQVRERRAILPNGEVRWLRCHASYNPGSSESSAKLIVTAFDITERKRAEEELRKQAERQALLLECTRLLLESQESEEALVKLLFDRVSKHLNVDTCFYYSYDPEHQYLNLQLAAGMPEEMLPSARILEMGQAFCGTSAQTRLPLVADAQRIATDEKGGFARSLGLNAYVCHPLFSSNGTLLGTMAVASRVRHSFTPEDIAFCYTLCHLIAITRERHVTELELRESEERFRDTFELAAVGIALVAPDGHWLRVNQRLCGMLGYTREEMLSLRFQDITHPEDIAPDVDLLQKVVAGEIPTYTIEKRYLKKDGSLVWGNLTVALKRDDDGQPEYFISVIEDITEKKRSEAERTYILESAGCLIWSSDVRRQGEGFVWHMWYFDEEAAERTVPIGRNLEKDYVERWREARILEDMDRNHQEGSRSLLAGQDWRNEFRMIDKNGEIHWLREDIRVETIEPGQRWHLVGVCIEITALKQALETVHGWDQVFAEAAFGLIHTDARTNTFIAVNPAFARQRGYTPEELIGKSMMIVSPPEVMPDLQEYLQHVNDIGHVIRESVHQRKDGTSFPVQVESTVIRDAEGKPISRIAYVQDITDRKTAEKELLDEKEQFAHIAATVPGVIYKFRLRPDGSIALPYFTTALYEIFDIPPEGLHEDASPLFQRVHPDDLNHFVTQIYHSAQTLTEWRCEFRVLHANKGVTWAEGRSIPVREEDGSILWYGFLADITERKRTEEEILHWSNELELRVEERTAQLAQAMERAEQAQQTAEQARAEAEKANMAKSEFLSRMSHELRTPMNSILGFAQVMEMQTRDEKQAARLAHILRAGQHLLQLINEVLDMARVESGRVNLSIEPVALDSVVQMAMDMIQPLCQQRELQLIRDTARCDSLFVLADQQRLSQVLLNLLSNAVKYNRPGGQVHIRCEPVLNGETIQIQIHDTGMGIASSELHRLFQPFERLNADDSSVEGTGLGLALSKRLVEAMGGTVGVKSELGVGSAFWIELPQTVGPAVIQSTPQPPPLVSRVAERNTVVYIEDNRANIHLIQELMREQENVKLLTAMKGTDGIELIRQTRPTLIMLDLHLPDMSGEEVLVQLRQDPELAKIPVIVISADATPKRIERLHERGITAYLSKPIDISQFFTAVAQALK